MLSRRSLLQQSLACAGLLSLPAAALAVAGVVVGNVTGLYSVEVARILRPQNTAELAEAVRAWPGQVAVGGGRFSMGGQVARQGGLHLDMRGMNRLLWLRAQDRCARVQAGMRWRDLQALLDPLNLAVKTMQSYANFTIGGAVSVNAHGRYVGHGPVGNTVRALQLVLADGSVVEASMTVNAELFRAALGAYGAVGIITEVELDLADNCMIERVVKPLKLSRYLDYFDRAVLGDGQVLLHNADLLPPEFDAPVAVSWRKTLKPLKALTELARLVPEHQHYRLAQEAIWVMTELPGGAGLRKAVVQPLLNRKASVKWLNHEASLDVAELEPRSRKDSTFVLQEYFVPRRQFLAYASQLQQALRSPAAEVLNVSIRHSPADTRALLPWAKEEVFCFVIYYKQKTDAASCEAVGAWTRRLIALALAHEGRYYLPYQLHATAEQFRRAYPEAGQMRDLKARVDPEGKFSNELWARYV